MASQAANPGPTARRPGARWLLALLIAINLLNYMDRYVLASLQRPIEAHHLANDPHAGQKFGWLATAILLAYMFLSPLFGWLGDRGSRWKLVALGVAVWSLATAGSGLAGTFTMLLLMRVIVGVGEASYGPVAPTIISDMYPVSRRGWVLAWFYMAIPVGGALGYALGGAFAATQHWRWAFYLATFPGLLLALIAFFIPDPPRGGADNITAHHHASPRDWVVLLRTPSYVLNTLGMTAMTFAIGGMAYWMPRYIYDGYVHGTVSTMSEQDIGFYCGLVIAAGGILGTLLGGIAGDLLRKRIKGAYFLVSGIALLIGFVLLLLMLRTPFPGAWGYMFAAVFFTFFNTGPSNTILANVTHPAIRSTAFALNIFIIHAFGDVISPPIMGAIRDGSNGDLRPAFLAVAAAMLIGGLFWLWGTKYLGRDTEVAINRLTPPK